MFRHTALPCQDNNKLMFDVPTLTIQCVCTNNDIKNNYNTKHESRYLTCVCDTGNYRIIVLAYLLLFLFHKIIKKTRPGF